MRRTAIATFVCTLAMVLGTMEAKKKKPEEQTQILQVPKDPPAAVTADTRRLVFHTSPLTSKGLLSQQARDGLKALFRLSGSATIVKIRAFVAGSGDLRRVRDIVSEVFTDHKLNLPALTVVQVGALPLEGAQVVLESIAVAKKDVNENGLVFISGQGASSNNPLDPVLPLAEKALGNVRTAVKGAGSEPSDVLRVTCLLSSLEQGNEVRQMFAREYPHAAFDYVQLQRAPVRALAECEAVAKLRWKTGMKLHLVNPDGITKPTVFSQLALVTAPKVVLSSAQVSFGFQDSDARLAFQRLQKALEANGASIRDTAFSSLYPLSQSLAEQVRKIRFEFYDPARPPASTMVPFEGLPSMDAGFAVDVVAIANR
jgi:enamine deaminase RidA (YjgF/YER057c/UK114 family)